MVSAGKTEVDFGRYRLVRRLARGGMAEVFLARQEGPAGFSKTLVIKRILPHLAQREDLVRMFLDEARIAAQFSHPNLVQVFDFGEESGSYFLAMEFLDGTDVHQMIRRARKDNRILPAELVVAIGAAASDGLHYAHTFVGEDGKALNIVHRDVSPSNIFVTKIGITKVVDFGVAKAEGRLERTRTGVIKGKYPYMSPEQATNRPLDQRSDVFSLGVTLYEMLTLKNPFRSKQGALNILRSVVEAKVTSPRELRPDITPDLEQVILTALQRDAGDRFSSAGEMRDALVAVLQQLDAPPASQLLAQFLASTQVDSVGMSPTEEHASTATATAPTRPEPGKRGGAADTLRDPPDDTEVDTPGTPIDPSPAQPSTPDAPLAAASPTPTPPEARHPAPGRARKVITVGATFLATAGLMVGVLVLWPDPTAVVAPVVVASELALARQAPGPKPRRGRSAPAASAKPMPDEAKEGPGGHLLVACRVPCVIWVDGRIEGSAPPNATIAVSSGSHQLRATTLDGQRTEKIRVLVAPQRAREVSFF